MSGQREAKRRVKMETITALLVEQNTRIDSWSPAAKAAITRYPVLASILASKHVMTCAKTLDAIPEADRALALDSLTLQDQDVLAALAEMPPMPERPHRLSADPQLASLIEVIERHSTPFNLATYTPARFNARIKCGE